MLCTAQHRVLGLNIDNNFSQTFFLLSTSHPASVPLSVSSRLSIRSGPLVCIQKTTPPHTQGLRSTHRRLFASANAPLPPPPSSVEGEARLDLSKFRRSGQSFELWETLHPTKARGVLPMVVKTARPAETTGEVHLTITYCPNTQKKVCNAMMVTPSRVAQT